MFGLVSVYGYGEKESSLVDGMLDEIEGWVKREGLDGFMVFVDIKVFLLPCSRIAVNHTWRLRLHSRRCLQSHLLRHAGRNSIVP